MTEETIQATEPAPDAVPVSQEVDSSPTTEGSDKPTAEAGPKTEDVITPVQKRFDRLTWEKNEHAREAEYWKSLALQQRNEPAKADPAPLKPPTLAQFDYDEAKYQAAVIEFTRAEARAAALEELKTAREREAAEARASSFKTREAEFIAKTPDYLEKVYDPSVPISPAMAELIAESPDGPAIAYHLANNPDQARRIANLSPLAAAREVGKIEAELSRPKPVPPAVSKAPAPPPKIDAVEPEVEKDPSKMTDKEFATWRRRQIAQRRNR